MRFAGSCPLEETMKKRRVSTGVLMALGAPVFGAPGLNLSWNTCNLGPGLANLNDACTAEFGAPYVLVCSLNPPDMPNFVAAAGIVKVRVQPDLGGVPAVGWWHYETGGCRRGGGLAARAL